MSDAFLQILQKIPLFKDLEAADLTNLSQVLKPKEFRKDQTILRRDEPGNALYMINRGKVKVVLYGESGREIILSILKDNDFFGEMALLDGAPRSASVVAVEPSKLFVLERSDFLEQVMKSPKIGLNIMAEMSRRLREADEKIGTFALLDVYGRLARIIIHWAKTEGQPSEGGILIEKRPTHQDIAAMIGTSRETVSRALSDFAKRGLIHVEGKSIVVSPVALEELQGESLDY